MQGYLETLHYPYVGSDHISSAFAVDKIVSKQIFKRKSLPLTKDFVLSRSDFKDRGKQQQNLQKIERHLGKKIVVKPARQGSAIGVAIVGLEGLYPALENAFELDAYVLIEEFIPGREITVGVLEREGKTEAFPVVEVVTAKGAWYDFERRYDPEGSQHLIPAPMAPDLTSELQQIALDAHHLLGCRDLSRADFLVNEKQECYLLEVNTMPGMTATSLYPDAARVAGYSLTDLASILINNAWGRRKKP